MQYNKFYLNTFTFFQIGRCNQETESIVTEKVCANRKNTSIGLLLMPRQQITISCALKYVNQFLISNP